jgi:hypothetical protein
MNVKFVGKEAYDAASAEDKASGRVVLRDATIIDRLKANLEGVLKYFLIGACESVADPLREPPAELMNAKLKAVKDLDDVSRWIMGYLVKDATSNISLRECKTLWRESGVSFCSTIREKGFNKRFFEKCAKLGFTVKWNESRSDEGKVLGVRFYDPHTDEEGGLAKGGGGGGDDPQ